MKVILELYTARVTEGTKHPLVLRFSVDRKTYRYRLGQSLTPGEYSLLLNRGGMVEAQEKKKKAETILDSIGGPDFNMDQFREMMESDISIKGSVMNWWEKYELVRSTQALKSRTRGLDDSAKYQLKEFLKKNPALNAIDRWAREIPQRFFDYMLENVSLTSAGIYTRNVRAFFNWIEEEELIDMRNPYKKFEIPNYENSWYPYTDEELTTIFSATPTTPRQERAKNWAELILFTGGTDMKDFAEMIGRQIQTDSIQMRRTKAKKKSGSAGKLLYKSPEIMNLMDRLGKESIKSDDFVFDIYKPGLSEDQNLEKLKALMNNINDSMNEMLEGKGIHFTIKRLRPTAATIANDSTKDVNYVSSMLQHASLKQTTTYLKNTPDKKVQQNQTKFEKALQSLKDPKKKKPVRKRSVS